MVESLENILKNGFQTWRNNLIIGVPFLLSALIGTILIVGLILFVIFFMVGSISLLGSSLVTSPPSLGSNVLPLLFLFILLIIIFVVLLSLINAFFEAGAIGMAKEVTQKGKTSLNDMVKYGKNKFISLFFADLLVGLIILTGLIILLGIFIGIPFLLGVFSGYGGMRLMALLFVILGIILIFLYLLVISVIFAPVSYTLVISNLGAIEGVKRGYGFFKEHKLDVFLLWLVILVIGLGVGIISSLIRLPLGFIPILGVIFSIIISILTALISLLVIAPLTAIWWTRLYLDKTEKIPQVAPSAKKSSSLSPSTPKKQDIHI